MKKNPDPCAEDEYRSCAFCTHSRPVGGELCLCGRKKTVEAGHLCRRFRLDLLRIEPRRAPSPKKTFSAEDFTL